MTARFPPEIFDLVIDHLHGDRNTLKKCSLVSKSWIPRTRKYLLSEVTFKSNRQLQNLKDAFPYPGGWSPTHHTEFLDVGHLGMLTPAYTEWLRSSFTNVTRFRVNTTHAGHTPLSDVHWHNLAAIIRAFPALEDLTMDEGINPPLILPRCTGTLTLSLTMESITKVLVCLPDIGRLTFRQIVCKVGCRDRGKTQPMTDLVEMYSDTLEAIFIESAPWNPVAVPIDFSKAKKLKEVEFQLNIRSIKWFAETLKTIPSENGGFKQISIRLPSPLGNLAKAPRTSEIYGQWAELDRLLVHLSEPGKIDTKVIYNKRYLEEETAFIKYILPQMVRGGRVELVAPSSQPHHWDHNS